METSLKYPIGKFVKPESITTDMIREYTIELESIPARFSSAVKGLSDEQLNTPYRPGGWTIRQVVHHIADSHMNALMRFKLTLTEDVPTIKPYLEAKWAELEDSKSMPVEPSLQLLNGIHQRLVYLLKSMAKDDFARKFFHPENQREGRLDEYLALYAWHGKHHLAHIMKLKAQMNWN